MIHPDSTVINGDNMDDVIINNNPNHTKENDQYEKQRIKEEDDVIARLLKPYSTFLVKYWFIVILGLLFVVIGSAILSIVSVLGAKEFPNFENPIKGFEPRGTTIKAQQISYDNLEKAYNKELFQFNKIRKRRSTNSPSLDLSLDLQYYLTSCVMVYEHVSKNNLFDHMKSICALYEKKIMNYPGYNLYFTGNTVHHIPNYIAFLSNKTNCQDISKKDIDVFIQLLSDCVEFYKSDMFKKCMNDYNECLKISKVQCYSHPLIDKRDTVARMFYNIFYYLADQSFANDVKNLKTTLSVDFISDWSGAQSGFSKPLYEATLKDLDSSKEGNIKIVAFELNNIKFYIFQTAILSQAALIATAIILVILLIWFYSGSIFIGLMTLACIIFALIISYFVYGRVFDMNFFPFLNMVTLIFLVGIGADDAFVYTGIWEEAKQVYKIKTPSDHDKYLVKWTTHTLRHALLAMLVTSLTTAAAFYANILSSINSVKCFGLYAGTSIIINYLLMVTFFPVVVIIHEKYFGKCMHKACPLLCKQRPVIVNEQAFVVTAENDPRVKLAVSTSYSETKSCFTNVQNLLGRLSDKLFNEYLPNVLKTLRYLWVFFFLCIGIGAAVVTFVKPGLKLPNTESFQMFSTSSSIEQWSVNYKKLFAFSKGQEGFQQDASFVFGVNAVDNGDYFDPDDKGKLVLNESPLYIEKVQTWLLSFCINLKYANFYQNSATCTKIEELFSLLKNTCAANQTECCGKKLPLPEAEFKKCFKSAAITLPGQGFSRPLYNSKGDLKTIVIQVTTKYQYSSNYQLNEDLYNTISSWFNVQLKNVTSKSFENGWWHMELRFYDLQKSLAKSTKESLGIAIAAAFVVILCTSWNILLSLYSILSITFVISVTIGILILSGWHLNIMESVVFSVAVGLSADFTLHYSVAYKTAMEKHNRIERVNHALGHIGPAILMGAFTTFIAGLVMLPATVLVYIQMAHFLMLTMFVSWIYSTFFFLPLCMTIGPTGNTGELTCKKVGKTRTSVKRRRHIEMEAVVENGYVQKDNDNIYDGPLEKSV